TAEADTGFVDHARGEVVRPARQNGLVKIRNVDKPAGSSVVVAVEVVVAIEQVAGGEAVSTQRDVIPDNKVKDVRGNRDDAGDSATLNWAICKPVERVGAGANAGMRDITRGGVAEAESVGSIRG